MLYKACPKCRGDLHFELDVAGGRPDMVCLQCGRRLSVDERTHALQSYVVLAHHRRLQAVGRR